MCADPEDDVGFELRFPRHQIAHHVDAHDLLVYGVGLDVPAWVRRLEDALRQTRDRTAEPPPAPPAGLTFEEVERQMDEWDKGLGE